MTRTLILFLALSINVTAFAQQAEEVINLVNPGFEDNPGCCSPPNGWIDCGKELETPPDVQPASPPIFAVVKPAFQGQTYLGLVVRDNDTWESVGQRLEKPLLKDKCYSFSLTICRSSTYLSGTKKDQNTTQSFTQPVVIRIWGGNDYCQRKEMLSECKPVENTDWKRFNFKLSPKFTHQYIIIEAFYKTPTLFPYNGNILVDNASAIQMIPCDKPEIPVVAVAKPKPKPEPEKPAKKNVAAANSKPKPAVYLKGLDPAKIKAGQIIPLDKLFFEMDSFNITPQSRPVLDELYEFLNNNQGIVVEIGGHTNNIPPDAYCEKLSTARARSVAEYLLLKGIDDDRLKYKGYGKRRPIASNMSLEGRRKNQRVEIKILQIET